MAKWKEGNNPPPFVTVQVEVEHCNKSLGLENETVVGQVEDDGFYFSDRTELSFNWDIIRWRKL